MVIAIANQKGGQGKTTTAQALVTGAAQIGRKALAVDLDPQGNLTFSMGGNAADVGAYEFITGKAAATYAIQKTKQGDVIASSSRLALADTAFIGEQRIKALAKALRPIRNKYDLIVIDCPPALNVLLVNALVAADKVIIPLTADMYSLQGLYQLIQTIKGAQEHNSRLEIGGVLFVRHNTRTVLARDLTEVIANKCRELDIPTYKTAIREGVAIREAQTLRESLFEYAPRANVTKDYMQLIKELDI